MLISTLLVDGQYDVLPRISVASFNEQSFAANVPLSKGLIAFARLLMRNSMYGISSKGGCF